MGNSLPSQGNGVPDEGSWLRQWMSPLRGRWVFIFGLVTVYGLLLVSTVQATKLLLTRHFDRVVAQAAREQGPTQALSAHRSSPWVRFGGVEVKPGVALVTNPRDATDFKIVRTVAEVSVPAVSPLMFATALFYVALLAQTLFLTERRRARQERARLEAAMAEREEAMRRAQRIEAELGEVRQRLAERVEQSLPAEEIQSLEEERRVLQEKLDALAQREAELRNRAGKAQSLEQERRALEELLEEALRDMERKDDEIQSLETRLRRAAKSESTPRRRREQDLLERRLRTLYKNLEIDDRAINDLLALRDEANILRAEEALKRLSEESEGATVRRKVAGLPAHLTVFELGFAGKGRIYYTRGRQRPFRILAIGAKNTQNTDLEYLSRLPKE